MDIMLRTVVLVVACTAVIRTLQRLSMIASRRKANRGRSILSPDETGADVFVRTNKKGVQLYCRRWGSLPEAEAAVLLVHSELLDGSFFKNFAQKLSEKKIVSYALDLTGFGKSGCQLAERSHIEAYSDYADDIDVLVEVAKLESGNCPIVLCGEGLGGTITLLYSMMDEYKEKISTVVVSSPKLQPDIEAEKVEGGIYSLWTKLMPTAWGPREVTEIDIASLFDDEEMGLDARMHFDSLQPASVKKIKEIAAMCDYVRSNMESITHPLFVVHGEDDKRHSMQQSETLKTNAASKMKYFRTYKDAKHGLLSGNQEGGHGVAGDVLGFIVRSLKGST